MTVREALVADPRVVPAGASAREVAVLLSRPHVTSALVVEGERLLGCVTKDSVVAAVARGDDVRRLTAAELADAEVATISPDATLDEALHVMAEDGLERLAVVEDGRLLGVVPREPLLRRIAEDEAPAADDEPPGYR